MNLSLDILNNHNETFQNDAVIINFKTDQIIWKPMMFSPKLNNDINYWMNERKLKGTLIF